MIKDFNILIGFADICKCLRNVRGSRIYLAM